jgi:hypothetical protein
MPLPQVNDRLKEIPAQALRTVFATIGQVLLVADRLRARVAGQPSGSGQATATRPADRTPAPAPPRPAKPVKPVKPARAAKPATPGAEPSRWRSLDKTGNVRLLDGDEEQDDEDVPVVTQAVSEPTPAPAPPAEYTPTEVVPAVAVPAEPAAAKPAPAKPAPAGPAPAAPTLAEVTAQEPVPVEPAHSEPAPAVVADSQALPVPNYDQLSVASLRARLRVLDAGQVQTLLDYEKAHESRPAVITLFERRLTKLDEGI